jgi:hypothetical protein
MSVNLQLSRVKQFTSLNLQLINVNIEFASVNLQQTNKMFNIKLWIFNLHM